MAVQRADGTAAVAAEAVADAVAAVAADAVPAPLTALSGSVGPAAALVALGWVRLHEGHLFPVGTAAVEPAAALEAAAVVAVPDPPRLAGPAAETLARLVTRGPELRTAVGALVRAEVQVRQAGGRQARAARCADQVWQLARVAAAEPLSRLFDHGADGELHRRLVASRSAPVQAFRQAVAATVAEWPHAGPGGWELGVPDWGTDPSTLLRLLDVLRRAPAARRPDTPAARHQAPLLRDRDRWADAVARIVHEQRVAARELGALWFASGHLVEAADVLHLHADELTALAADPTGLRETARLRAYDHAARHHYRRPAPTPGPLPPVVRWARRDAAPRAADGDVLTGRPGSTGRGTGTVADPADRLPPDPVLLLPGGGAQWVPLIRIARGVVIDRGSAHSPAVAACRASAVPCVTGTGDAADRLTPGTVVRVDGDAGVVRVGP